MLYMMSKTVPEICNVKVSISEAKESSGNRQFYVQVTRTEDSGLFGTTLDYSCHQTKYVPTVEECLDRALYDAGKLLEFFGKKYLDLKLNLCFDDSEKYAMGQLDKNLYN